VIGVPSDRSSSLGLEHQGAVILHKLERTQYFLIRRRAPSENCAFQTHCHPEEVAVIGVPSDGWLVEPGSLGWQARACRETKALLTEKLQP